jgi:hypothetical protein
MKPVPVLIISVVFCLCTSLQNVKKQPHEVLVEKIVKALKKENSRLFATSCIPTQQNFNILSQAVYASRPELVKGLQTKPARDSLIKKERESFDRLIQEGKRDKIIWSRIKLKRTGISITAVEKKVNRLNIPFDIESEGKEYGIVLEFCTQLIRKPEIINPGEFRWEGIK